MHTFDREHFALVKAVICGTITDDARVREILSKARADTQFLEDEISDMHGLLHEAERIFIYGCLTPTRDV